MEKETKRQSDKETKCASSTPSLRHFVTSSLLRRPGSVLIIVIVLLLLLAILGAAYISTTRSARVASAQNVTSSDVDDMINGIAKVCEGVITDDLNDTFGDLHGNTAYTANTTIVNRSYYQGQAGAAPSFGPNATGANVYNPGDIVNDALNPYSFYTLATGTTGTPNTAIASPPWTHITSNLPFTATGADPWLADRIPDPVGTGTPRWTALTQLIQYSAAFPNGQPVSILGTPFVDPRTGTTPSGIPGTPLLGGLGAAGYPSAQPDSEPLNNGLFVPGIEIPPGNTPGKFACGNADGDGIADSLMFQIPGAAYDGLTWYAAVRIVDNNSAINANTAWSRVPNAPYGTAYYDGGTNPWGLFPTSVGLSEILNASDSINNVNTYRFNGSTPAAASTYDESPIAIPPATTPNAPPAGVARPDYNFIGEDEALYQQMIRRMANPGYVAAGARYQPFPLSDEAALAYHFCLQNPNSMAQSVLETVLPNSLDNSVSSTPYDPSNVTAWFIHNFSYTPNSDPVVAGNASLRPLLVTYNPVSNYIPQVYNNNGGTAFTSDPILPIYMLPYGPNTATGNPHFKGVWRTPNPPAIPDYAANDIVVYPGPLPSGTDISYTFMLVNPINPSYVATNPPATFTNNVLTAIAPGWQLQPFSSNAVKANVNTATFPELFRAFWCVMAGNPSNATPFGTTGVDSYNIYDNTPPTTISPTTGNPQCMFRSPLRDPVPGGSGSANVSLLDVPTTAAGKTTVTNQNVMLLRAAIAAVNALGLRDNTQNIISRTIDLASNSQVDNNGSAAQVPVELQVFSNAPNPVISEVYVDTDATDPQNGGTPYVAVELYNPYSVPLTLVNWQLGLINRSTTAGTNYPVIYPHLSFQTNGAYAAPPAPASTPSVSVIGPATGQMQAENAPSTQPSTSAGSTTPPPPGVIIMQAHGYALLENYNAIGTAATGDAKGRPTGAAGTGGPNAIPAAGIWWGPGGQTNSNTCDVYVQNLQLVVKGATGTSITGPSTGGELVLLRPRQANGIYTTSADPFNFFSEGTGVTAGSTQYPGLYTSVTPNLYDMVPVDSFDFDSVGSGTALAAGSNTAWSYIRAKCGQTVATNPPLPSLSPSVWFKAVFPGFYNATNLQRQGGTGIAVVTGGAQGVFTPLTASPEFGFDSATGSYTNNFPPIQIYNNYFGDTGNDVMHFPNAVISPGRPTGINGAGTPNLYPLGGFARNGDMLDIPFIGAYRIRILDPGNTTLNQVYLQSPYFLEMNSLPMDASLAAIETTVAEQDAAENVGRFVPMAATNEFVTAIQTGKYPDGNAATTPLPDYYSWTRNLFNYLTVQSSSDAYLPNFDPNVALSNVITPTFAYPPQNSGTPLPPTPTLTANPAAYDQTLQDNVGVEGLININTASWKVLSMLPMVTPSEDPTNWQEDNQSLAKAIVNWRLIHGPFTSIYDLNAVMDTAPTNAGKNAAAGAPIGFQNAEGWLNPANGSAPPITGAPGTALSSANGIISPPDPAFPNITNPTGTPAGVSYGTSEDYQSDCAVLTRISNLITTRSDTFTVYIEVQGWQNVNTANAQPMVTRHYAFIVDRSAVNSDPGSRFLKTLAVPND